MSEELTPDVDQGSVEVSEAVPVKKERGPNKKEREKLIRNSAVLASLQTGYDALLDHDIVSSGIALCDLARKEVFKSRGEYPCPVADQLVRALNSVAANFVEGYGRGQGDAFINFLVISRASAYEALVHARTIGWEYYKHVETLVKKVDQNLQEELTR